LNGTHSANHSIRDDDYESAPTTTTTTGIIGSDSIGTIAAISGDTS
jgi:hypothetical protein